MNKVYEGKRDYLFISYAHKDSELVMPIIEKLQSSKVLLWYDAGIQAGTEWPDYIAKHLSGSAVVLIFLTDHYIQSPNCRNELNYALNRKKKIFSINFGNVSFQNHPGIEMQLNSVQGIVREKYDSEETFFEDLLSARLVDQLRLSDHDYQEADSESVDITEFFQEQDIGMDERSNINITPFLKRIEIFLSEGNWANASAYCEKVLDIDPENADAYLGKLLASQKIKRRDELKQALEPFDMDPNFDKILRFGSQELAQIVTDANDTIVERKKNEFLVTHYSEGVKLMESCSSIKDSAKLSEQYQRAIDEFEQIKEYRDADRLKEECILKKEKADKVTQGFVRIRKSMKLIDSLLLWVFAIAEIIVQSFYFLKNVTFSTVETGGESRFMDTVTLIFENLGNQIQTTFVLIVMLSLFVIVFRLVESPIYAMIEPQYRSKEVGRSHPVRIASYVNIFGMMFLALKQNMATDVLLVVSFSLVINLPSMWLSSLVYRMIDAIPYDQDLNSKWYQIFICRSFSVVTISIAPLTLIGFTYLGTKYLPDLPSYVYNELMFSDYLLFQNCVIEILPIFTKLPIMVLICAVVPIAVGLIGWGLNTLLLNRSMSSEGKKYLFSGYADKVRKFLWLGILLSAFFVEISPFLFFKFFVVLTCSIIPLGLLRRMKNVYPLGNEKKLQNSVGSVVKKEIKGTIGYFVALAVIALIIVVLGYYFLYQFNP